ncbi:hypothetical protein CYMTET_43438 [Cymbomonas tetramitiformis]|uniref:Uncharacterized protein n=1 Tax=Cymbomonas tetramitiformis TaxID=36881 RepID=A0AAE0C3F8_9CHLO|nr:hypothetical protein CYMTET_43438 [Cymbomonas tetramitiformis]
MQLPMLQLPVLQLPMLQRLILQLSVLQLPVLQLPVLQLPVLQLPVLDRKTTTRKKQIYEQRQQLMAAASRRKKPVSNTTRTDPTYLFKKLVENAPEDLYYMKNTNEPWNPKLSYDDLRPHLFSEIIGDEGIEEEMKTFYKPEGGRRQSSRLKGKVVTYTETSSGGEDAADSVTSSEGEDAADPDTPLSD